MDATTSPSEKGKRQLMCLYVNDDGIGQIFSEGIVKSARTTHTCYECGRRIDPGESYWRSVLLREGEFAVEKMCAHCDGTLQLGCALTGCQRAWYWDRIHDLDGEEGGFVGDIIGEHELAHADRIRMLRTVVGRRKGWRRADGSLLPVPAVAG